MQKFRKNIVSAKEYQRYQRYQKSQKKASIQLKAILRISFIKTFFLEKFLSYAVASSSCRPALTRACFVLFLFVFCTSAVPDALCSVNAYPRDIDLGKDLDHVQKRYITYTNDGPSSETITLMISDDSNYLKGYISIVPEMFFLEPGRSRNVEITFRPIGDLSPERHVFRITASSSSNNILEDANVNIYIDVEGDAQPDILSHLDASLYSSEEPITPPYGNDDTMIMLLDACSEYLEQIGIGNIGDVGLNLSGSFLVIEVRLENIGNVIARVKPLIIIDAASEKGTRYEYHRDDHIDDHIDEGISYDGQVDNFPDTSLHTIALPYIMLQPEQRYGWVLYIDPGRFDGRTDRLSYTAPRSGSSNCSSQDLSDVYYQYDYEVDYEVILSGSYNEGIPIPPIKIIVEHGGHSEISKIKKVSLFLILSLILISLVVISIIFFKKSNSKNKERVLEY